MLCHFGHHSSLADGTVLGDKCPANVRNAIDKVVVVELASSSLLKVIVQVNRGRGGGERMELCESGLY